MSIEEFLVTGVSVRDIFKKMNGDENKGTDINKKSTDNEREKEKSETGSIISKEKVNSEKGQSSRRGGAKKNNEKDLHWLILAAEDNDLGSMYKLGLYYYEGVEVNQDYEKAAYWFTKAANKGHPYAQHKLGMCYYYGDGVVKDEEKAEYWFNKAEKQGYSESRKKPRRTSQHKNDINQLEPEDAEEQFKIGMSFYRGDGVKRDYVKAVYWLTKAAEQGKLEAQYNIGICYYDGYGVRKNYEKSAYWFKKAVEQGNSEAQHYLERCYSFLKEDAKISESSVEDDDIWEDIWEEPENDTPTTEEEDIRKELERYGSPNIDWNMNTTGDKYRDAISITMAHLKIFKDAMLKHRKRNEIDWVEGFLSNYKNINLLRKNIEKYGNVSISNEDIRYYIRWYYYNKVTNQ